MNLDTQQLAAAQRVLERQFAASRDVRWLVTLAQLATQAAASHFPLVAALETTLLRAQHLLESSDHHSVSSPKAKTAIVIAYRQLLAACAGHGDYQDALSRVALVLAACWVRMDHTNSCALELLAAAADGCAVHAKWPLVARGALSLVAHRDDAQALRCFHDAALLDPNVNDQHSQAEGAFRFWFGAALFKCGHMRGAAEQLERALRCDFEPVMSLNLTAAAHVRGAGDWHAAARELQRALEIDFGATDTLFNYAVLLGGMRNFEAQQQMLEYYVEAGALAEAPGPGERKRERSGSLKSQRTERLAPVATATVGASSLPMGSEAQAEGLFAPNPSRVTDVMVAKELAYAALENEDYPRAKQHFEQLLALESAGKVTGAHVEMRRDYIYVLLQSNLHELALSKCDQIIVSMQGTASGDPQDDWLLLLLYRADALLCLERVDECHQYLRQFVEPQISKSLKLRKIDSATSVGSDDNSSGDASEVVACHIQLINNLAVVSACVDIGENGGVDTAITMLRDGIQLYPLSLSLKFNLVLLLWRKEQKEAACAIWFEARKWSLHMSVGDVGDDRKAIEMVAAAEEAAISAAASPHPQISEHVRAGGNGEDGVSSQQLLYLDALVLNHWGKIQSSRTIQTSIRYVQYIDSLNRHRGEGGQLSWRQQQKQDV